MGACDGKVALITGASRGFGQALALRLAAEGASVGVVARSLDAESLGTSLAATVAEIEGLGSKAFAVEADLADGSRDRGFIVEAVEGALGPIDILVNNAAAGGFKPFVEWSDHRMRLAQEVNNWAAWELVRRALPGMVERGRGWILNISSAAAEPPGPPLRGSSPERFGTIYGGTKAMLNRWTLSLGAEMIDAGVRVNTLAPQAAVATQGVLKAIEAGMIRTEDTEPLESMVEAALALVTGEHTMRVGYSLELVVEILEAVRDLRGEELVDGWQPADVEAMFAAGRFRRFS
jgi:NAD(P)-dependent dehydrogenase (short-subunit alcohol dehydrogenase family)